jgi:biopolymer transport protein ExbD
MQPKRHRSNQLIGGVIWTPFVHVTIVLFAVFLLGSLMLPKSHHGVGPDLPRVWHPVSMPHANREDAMVVAILRDDKVFFRNDRVTPDQLPAKIRDSIAQGAERKVYIRADLRAKYGWVAEVLDNMHSGGVEKIGFLVYEKGHVPMPSPQ